LILLAFCVSFGCSGRALVALDMPRSNAASTADPLENHKRYEKTKNLNAGAFGFVQLARDKLNKGAYVAVKFIPRGEQVNEYVEAEIINHRQLLHPHIIQFQEVGCPSALLFAVFLTASLRFG
jgi:serine/threonine protein kinase